MQPSNPPNTGIFGGLSNSQQPNPNTGGLFGAGGFGGANAGFPMGGNNPQPQGGMGFGAQPQAGGGLFGTQQNNNQQGGPGLFGGGTGGLFGAGGNNNATPQQQTGGIFGGGGAQNNNANNNFGGGAMGLGLATTPSFNLGPQQQAGGMMVGGNAGAGGTIGAPFDRAQTKRGNENCWVQSINAMSVYKDKVFS